MVFQEVKLFHQGCVLIKSLSFRPPRQPGTCITPFQSDMYGVLYPYTHLRYQQMFKSTCNGGGRFYARPPTPGPIAGGGVDGERASVSLGARGGARISTVPLFRDEAWLDDIAGQLRSGFFPLPLSHISPRSQYQHYHGGARCLASRSGSLLTYISAWGMGYH